MWLFMKYFTVAFFGHRYIDNPLAVEERLEEIITELIRGKEFVEFLVGRNGDFDLLVSSTVRRVKRNYGNDNSYLCLVLPYETSEYTNNTESFEAYYDDIEISVKAAEVHPKAAIKIRNREMADRAEIIVCYLTEEYGGAYEAVKYARSQSKKIINTALQAPELSEVKTLLTRCNII